MEIDSTVFVFTMYICIFLSFSVSPLNAFKKPKYIEPTFEAFKEGGLSRICRTNTDCGSFGYICGKNKTCQCSENYLVDYKNKLCLGGIDQKCKYDEHCIENAYCMNQSTCQCKDKWPIASYDGLECNSGSKKKIKISIIFIISITSYFMTKT